ncbi:hypothetical protein E4U55_001084 [Claviceps digitariae]|nr:hypothetical protein E4U55_001084 [Claviceps digitariae]
MGLKEQISSPLEAGPSLLDGHHLPPHLTPALEYASGRLARKSVHLTLVVVRRDYHVPSTPVSSSPSPSSTSCSFYSGSGPGSGSSSGSSSPSFASSMCRLSFATGSVTALKQLVRSGSYRHGGAESRGRGSTARNASTPMTTTTARTAAAGNSSIDSPGLGLQWPLSPSTAPLSSPPPMTPCTPSSMATTTTTTTTTTTDHLGPPTPGGAPGLLFLHAPDLSPRDQKIQRAVFTKTAHKFNLPLLLHPAASPMAYGLSSQLFTNSLLQHDVLFSSDSLTLLSLDRLYSLKAALASYARTKTPLRLEDAVDELRRYVLASHGAKVTRSDLCRAYDWLNVGPAAVADLDGMYRRVYGGPDQLGAIAGLETTAPPPPPPPQYHDHHPRADDYPLNFHQDQDAELPPEQIGLAITTYSDLDPRPASPARVPALTVQTNFPLGSRPEPLVLRSKWGYEDDDDDDDEDGSDSQRILDGTTPPAQDLGNPSSQIQDSPPPPPPPPTTGQLPRRNPEDESPTQHHTPMTPNSDEDISPVTRGEWGFLMVNKSFGAGERLRGPVNEFGQMVS